MLWTCCTQYASKFGKLSSGNWKRSVFIPIPKKGNAKECSNYHTTARISHSSKAMLKILQARLQQYVNFQMFKLVLEKAEEPEIKFPTSAGTLKKQESSRKISIFCFIDYGKAFDCVDHNKLWKTLKEMGIPDHLTCLLRNSRSWWWTGRPGVLRFMGSQRVSHNWVTKLWQHYSKHEDSLKKNK